MNLKGKYQMISVAMTTLNGLPYVREQISSILPQLAPTDELVVSDDGSTDGTLAYLEGLAWGDKRLKLLEGPGTGLIDNFANTLLHCRGDIIFLSDHDDVWLPDKIEQIKTIFALNPKVILVQHNARFTDSQLNPQALTTFAWRKVRPGLVANLLRNRYHGCTMAFRHELLYAALPFPKAIPMHDQWLGMIAETIGGVIFYDEVLSLYRRHEKTMTTGHPHSWAQMYAWRKSLWRELKQRRRDLKERDLIKKRRLVKREEE